jgi:hypothetical protein
MNSKEIISGMFNPGQTSEERETQAPRTPDLETPECSDNRHITSTFEEVESGTQAHAEEPNNCFKRYWERYHTVLGHIIIWVLSTSYVDIYIPN